MSDPYELEIAAIAELGCRAKRLAASLPSPSGGNVPRFLLLQTLAAACVTPNRPLAEYEAEARLLTIMLRAAILRAAIRCSAPERAKEYAANAERILGQPAADLDGSAFDAEKLH